MKMREHQWPQILGHKIVMVAALFLGCLPPAIGQTLLLDNFTTDTTLNTSLWTSQTNLSVVLTALAAHNSSKWLAPSLSFGPTGMQMSGIGGDDQFTGLVAMQTYSPPLTFAVTVEGIIAHGNVFEVYLVNSNLSSGMSLSGNLNSTNDPYYGIWLNYQGGGTSFDHSKSVLVSQPTNHVPYTIELSLDGLGNGSLLLTDTNGNPLALDTQFVVGTGPFYVVLAQREGLPTTSGTNIAVWHSASVVRGAIPPVQITPAISYPVTPSDFTLMLQGPIGSNYLIETSTDLRQWSSLTNLTSTNTPFFYQDSHGGIARFYRAKLETN